MTGRVRWVAFTSLGLAHAIPCRGRVVRAACSAPVLPDNLTWPERTRCIDCVRIALGGLA